MSELQRPERRAALRRKSPSPFPDAGLRGHGHYERRLPVWRFRLRNQLIPIVRWETPYLARMQKACRRPWLDTYFAFTANLGTHTFFMTALPICFWCGYTDIGIAMVHMLAMGVYLSGFVKDLACLPRPLSPPLHRITMSGSAALEYGFPSTHTTNAVSVALFCLYQLHLVRENYSGVAYNVLRASLYCYATSITFGRMYCGMHGFFDVIFGAGLGATIAWVRIAYGAMFDSWVLADGWMRPAIVVALLTLAIRVHPEPADNCPCFDDSVSFVGVVMGIELGIWHYAQRAAGSAMSAPSPGSLYPTASSDPVKATARIVGGILVIFLWRAVMKPTLLRVLPPIFRFVAHGGLSIPRRYFLQAREYRNVPPLRKDDNVIPPAMDIPALVSSLRNPRKRRVSVGPQSEADAREYIANRMQRRQKRRNSRGSTGAASTKHRPSDAGASSDSGKEDEKNDREMFSALEKPRIRYDVEVITKLVVYAGIAWLAVEGNPLWFEAVGII
ncbi:hypothetical protein BAUCODRAFT_126761 [Baudoinia panamericana UAMH 10762]|uniref:Phosphatidic acid phosphatase type 2/haloperoxidase domain-containing protein n=1 Tax=Baudoinia panamericana (strain UAMH 10762) TaxID=717646 RepID=M2MKB3_BAUPA|nr:uncharacterized protein BAUCODRAFT_126761 [Baudoinia panamericana UAMH 10762]EMC91768.1 hypothetical protein BAUCODRAFT_126761 [Baudoinia panamericana UAMH 10762]